MQSNARSRTHERQTDLLRETTMATSRDREYVTMVACTQCTACSLPASWGSNERYISTSKDWKIFCASWTDVSSVENVMAFGSALSPSSLSLSNRSQPYYLFRDKLPLPITVAPPPRSIGVDDDASLCLLLAQMPNLTTLLPSFSTAINSAVDVVQNTN